MVVLEELGRPVGVQDADLREKFVALVVLRLTRGSLGAVCALTEKGRPVGKGGGQSSDAMQR